MVRWRLPYRHRTNCTHHKRVQTLCFPVGQFWSGLGAQRRLTASTSKADQKKADLPQQIVGPKIHLIGLMKFLKFHILVGVFFYRIFASEAGGIKKMY